MQGVGFRVSMQDEAERLGAIGWVRNRRDGAVEAVVIGSGTQCAALLAWSQRGPRGARVTQVEKRVATADEIKLAGDSFTLLPTG